MNTQEKKALEIIRNWSYFLEKIETLYIKLKEDYYPLTNTLSFTPHGSGGNQSKVEIYTLNYIAKKEKYKRLVDEKNFYLKVFECSQLSNIERDLISVMAKGITPVNYARLKKIQPIESIYSIQYSAIRILVEKYNELLDTNNTKRVILTKKI